MIDREKRDFLIEQIQFLLTGKISYLEYGDIKFWPFTSEGDYTKAKNIHEAKFQIENEITII